MFYSPTAEYHCSKKRWFRWVSRLSQGERDAVRAGSLVWFSLSGRTHYTQSGLKIVVYTTRGRWNAREPTREERKAILNGRAIGINGVEIKYITSAGATF